MPVVTSEEGGSEGPRLGSGPISTAFQSWFAYAKLSSETIELAHHAFKVVSGLPVMWKFMQHLDPAIAKPSDLDTAREDAQVARREMEAGFPLLHAQSLLGLWGAFEALVEDVCIAALLVRPSLLAAPPFERVKVPVTVLTSARTEDWYRQIMAEAARSIRADVADGVSKFEGPLGLVGLGGPVPRPIREAVFTGQRVRNVWAHRAGVADERFVSSCPKFGVEKGQLVAVREEEYHRLALGLDVYAHLIFYRIIARFTDVDATPDETPDPFEGVFRGVDFTTGGPAGGEHLT